MPDFVQQIGEIVVNLRVDKTPIPGSKAGLVVGSGSGMLDPYSNGSSTLSNSFLRTEPTPK